MNDIPKYTDHELAVLKKHFQFIGRKGGSVRSPAKSTAARAAAAKSAYIRGAPLPAQVAALREALLTRSPPLGDKLINFIKDRLPDDPQLQDLDRMRAPRTIWTIQKRAWEIVKSGTWGDGKPFIPSEHGG